MVVHDAKAHAIARQSADCATRITVQLGDARKGPLVTGANHINLPARIILRVGLAGYKADEFEWRTRVFVAILLHLDLVVK